MTLSAFDDKAHPPEPHELRTTLGHAWSAWIRLVELVREPVPSLNELWAFAGKSTGWGMRLREGDRVLAYMTPRRGSFLFSIVLGEAAVARATSRKLPAAILAAIDAAPLYAEGRGVRFEVEDDASVAAFAELVTLKREKNARKRRS